MDLELDKKRFQRFMELKYGVSIIVHTSVSKSLTNKHKKVKKWVSAVCHHFGCTVDDVFTKTRKNNKYYSIWTRYMLSVHEGIHDDKLGELFGVDRTTILYDKKICRGWVEVYPEVYEALVNASKLFSQPKKYKYELQIKKIKL